MIPLVDALTVSSLGDKSGDYGRVRVWGSVAFAAAVFVVGGLMDGWSDAPMGLAAALLVATAVLTWRLPSGPFAAPRAGCST